MAMGSKMSKQKIMGYNPYYLMFGSDPTFQGKLQPLQEKDPDPEAKAERLQIVLDERG